jgi:hypothetical protein
MKRQIFLIIFASFLCFDALAQKLTLSDLEKIYQLSDDEIDTYLSLKGFEFNKVAQKDNSNSVGYVYKSTIDSGWQYITKHTWTDGETLLTYTIFDLQSYTSIKQTLSKIGYVYSGKEINDGKLILKYKKGNLFLRCWLGNAKKSTGESYNLYELNISTQDY